LDIFEIFLKKTNENFNVQNANLDTPLHLCAKSNFVEGINFLLKNTNVDVNIRNFLD